MFLRVYANNAGLLIMPPELKRYSIIEIQAARAALPSEALFLIQPLENAANATLHDASFTHIIASERCELAAVAWLKIILSLAEDAPAREILLTEKVMVLQGMAVARLYQHITIAAAQDAALDLEIFKKYLEMHSIFVGIKNMLGAFNIESEIQALNTIARHLCAYYGNLQSVQLFLDVCRDVTKRSLPLATLELYYFQARLYFSQIQIESFPLNFVQEYKVFLRQYIDLSHALLAQDAIRNITESLSDRIEALQRELLEIDGLRPESISTPAYKQFRTRSSTERIEPVTPLSTLRQRPKRDLS